MPYDYGLFIDGAERPARSGATIDVRNPATGQVIGRSRRPARRTWRTR